MLTPRHSFGSISQRIDAFCPEMRAAQTTICADAALTQSARRRVRIGASRSGRGSCAARIQEWLSPRYRGSHLRAVEAAVVCSPVGSGATMRSALHACCGAGLFVRSVGKFQTAEQIACCGAERAFRSPNGSKWLTVSARFSIAVRLFRPARLLPIDPRSGVARVGSNAARTPPFPARCAFPIHCG
jgi:hypothetical protein